MIYGDDADREYFLKLLGQSAERFRWILTAYVLMPNHYHLVVQLTDQMLSRGIKWLNGRYAQYFNRRHARVGHLFQGRFKGILVEKEAYQLEVLRYVALNPVRARMTASPESYTWSSHQAVLGHVPSPDWLAVDDALIPFAPRRDRARALYRDFVNDGIRREAKLWNNVVGQMYLGREEWIDLIRERVALKPRSQEHPRSQRLQTNCSMQEVIAVVADAFSIPEHRIRNGHGGTPRMVAAWIAWNQGLLTQREIAEGLCLRGRMQITRLVQSCRRELESNATLREKLQQCVYRS